jgi:hypothetical protein
LSIEIVKPKTWDAGGAIVLGAAMVLAAANLMLSASSDVSISGATTIVFVFLHMGLCLLCFMVLGKTASQGTIWGNLLALAGSFVAGSGTLLATALWALG